MTESHLTHAAFGRQSKRLDLQPDEPIHWGCSLKGWNCCVDKGIPVRPYDMVRLRHSLQQPAHEITADKTVTFAWHGATGALVGSLAHRPYTPGHLACIFLEEITNVSAARMRAEDPERFASMPLSVQRAADATAANEYGVAGLCVAHLNRPDVCRGFPFQRRAQVDPSGMTVELGMMRVNVCGSCALTTPTTPREAVGSEAFEYWRANDAFSATLAYLRSRGAARVQVEGYRPLPVSDADLTQLWAAMYLPDSDATILQRFPEQWRAPLDIEHDRVIYRMLLDQALDRLDRVIADSGIDPGSLGFADVEPVQRPNLDALLDPARPILGTRPADAVA